MLDAIRITQREEDVLRLVCAGLEAKEIASRLDIANQTVRVHLRSLRLKLKARNRVEMLRWALATRLVEINEN